MIYIKIGKHYLSKSKIVCIDIKKMHHKEYTLDITYIHPHAQYNLNSTNCYYLSTIDFQNFYQDIDQLKLDCHKILDNNPHCEINNLVEEIANEIDKIIKNNKYINNE